MKRVLLICLSLVLALVGGSAACAEDGFYVIGGGGSIKSKVFAMGVIKRQVIDGQHVYTVSNGKNINSAVWDSVSRSLIIQFTNGDYNTNNHITLITPLNEAIIDSKVVPVTVSYHQAGTNAVSVSVSYCQFSASGGYQELSNFSIIVLPPN